MTPPFYHIEIQASPYSAKHFICRYYLITSDPLLVYSEINIKQLNRKTYLSLCNQVAQSTEICPLIIDIVISYGKKSNSSIVKLKEFIGKGGLRNRKCEKESLKDVVKKGGDPTTQKGLTKHSFNF